MLMKIKKITQFFSVQLSSFFAVTFQRWAKAHAPSRPPKTKATESYVTTKVFPSTLFPMTRGENSWENGETSHFFFCWDEITSEAELKNISKKKVKKENLVFHALKRHTIQDLSLHIQLCQARRSSSSSSRAFHRKLGEKLEKKEKSSQD